MQATQLQIAETAAREAIKIAAPLARRNDSAQLCVRDARAVADRATCVGDFMNAIERCIRSVQHSQGVFTVHQSRLLALRQLAKGAA